MAVSVIGVHFEHLREPFGIGESRPRVSWRVSTEASGWSQAAYEIEVVDQAGGQVWSSGRVESAESVLVPWDAPVLESRARRAVRVRVWGAGEEAASPWSEASIVEAGLLSREDWSARLIGPDRDEGDRLDRPPVLFRRPFELSGQVEQARLYVTAHGVYTAEINGTRVGDHVLAPGWTSYRHRLRYQTFDVTSLLARGRNVLGRHRRGRLVRRAPGIPRRAAPHIRRRRGLARPARDPVRGRADRDPRHRRRVALGRWTNPRGGHLRR